jgi:hypothetical protein
MRTARTLATRWASTTRRTRIAACSLLLDQAPNSAFRSVKLLDNYSYFSKPTQAMSNALVAHHGQDMAVIAHDVSSVNHTVGQQRSLNGAGFDRGRTLAESIAMQHGQGLPLPSCTMAIDGYVRHGTDASVPPEARHELIMAPTVFATGTHGYRGLTGVPGASAIERARKLRDKLESESVFGQTFKDDTRRGGYLRARSEVSARLEQANLLDKLLPQTSKPDKQRTMTESDVYGIIAQAFGVPAPEGRSYPGVVR